MTRPHLPALGRTCRRLLAAAIVLAPSAATAEDVWVELREDAGQLGCWSPLPAGVHRLPAMQFGGRSISGRIQVADGRGERREVTALEVECWGDEVSLPSIQQRPNVAPLREGFATHLKRTPTGGFELKVARVAVDGTELDRRQTTLQREPERYYMGCVEGQTVRPTVESQTFVDLMLEYPEAYRQFEQTAHACSIPGIRLVPRTAFSPTVIRQVIDGVAHVDPGPTADQWHDLVTLLDSDSFAQREAASRELTRAGAAVAVYLENLDARSLSLEQRARIGYILAAVGAAGPTEPRPLPADSIARIRQNPPVTWLVRLVLSADADVRDWALGRLRSSGVHESLSATATRAQRRELFSRLWTRLADD